MTGLSRLAVIGSLLGAGVLVVVAVAVAQQANNTFYARAKGDSIRGPISVDTQPDCPTNGTIVSWNSEGPEGPQGPQGPAGPRGPQGEPGTSADLHSFDVLLNTGDEAIILAADGWELKAQCSANSMVVSLRHAADSWKRISLAPVPASQFVTINTVGIVNGLGEGTMGLISAYTDNGDVFLSSANSSIITAVSNGSCLFAGAPQIQMSP